MLYVFSEKHVDFIYIWENNSFDMWHILNGQSIMAGVAWIQRDSLQLANQVVQLSHLKKSHGISVELRHLKSVHILLSFDMSSRIM